MRKWILILLSVISVVLCAIGLAACVPKDLQAHTWSEEWRRDIDSHWRYCTDTGCTKETEHETHDLVVHLIIEGREPTCGDPGRAIQYCTVCDVLVEDFVAPTGDHEWELLFTDALPTCSEPGRKTEECAVCKSIRTVEIPPTGDHVYTGKLTPSENGHEELCAVCGGSKGLEAHKEITKTVTSPNPTTLDPGLREVSCSVCGYVIREEVIPNSSFPDEFKATLRYNGQLVAMTPYADGYRVNMYPTDEEGTANRYEVLFSATRNNGSMSVACPSGDASGANYGVKAYLRDSSLRDNSLRDDDSLIMFYYYPEPGAEQIANMRIRAVGEYTIVFKFESGNGKSTIEFVLYVTCSNSRAVSASELSAPLAIVEDGAECLAIGCYESKSY